MTRYTNNHEPEDHEIEAFTQPDVRLPGDGEWRWMLWFVFLPLGGLLMSYLVINVIEWLAPILRGIFSW